MNARKRTREARLVLAENLRRLRERMGVSQERLAEMAGFHRTYVSQVERQKVNTSVDNLEKLAQVLDVPTHLLLLDGDEEAKAE